MKRIILRGVRSDVREEDYIFCAANPIGEEAYAKARALQAYIENSWWVRRESTLAVANPAPMVAGQGRGLPLANPFASQTDRMQ